MSEEKQRLEGRKILIVDDDRDIRVTIDAVLQAEGASTQVVDNGNDAVKICREDRPDLVVLDMMLPRRSGFLVLEKIKGRADSPLVIMITANEGRRHRTYAEQIGADKYLLKPVPLQFLVETIADLIDQRDQQEVGMDLEALDEDEDPSIAEDDADDDDLGDEEDSD